jgi:hypothetical protein
VRVIVRPDRRGEYLTRWRSYEQAVREVGAEAWLFEDQALPGRFLELTQHDPAGGVEAGLEWAVQQAELRGACARREGDEILYRRIEAAE